MNVNVYLSFTGQCETAFNFCAECFGGQLGGIFRYAGSPMAETMPDNWQDKIMHGFGIQWMINCETADPVSSPHRPPSSPPI